VLGGPPSLVKTLWRQWGEGPPPPPEGPARSCIAAGLDNFASIDYFSAAQLAGATRNGDTLCK
jgi:hypothetical protein